MSDKATFKWHFTRVCTVCLDKIDLLRKKYFSIMICNSSIYTMDHPDVNYYPDLNVLNFMENMIVLK